MLHVLAMAFHNTWRCLTSLFTCSISLMISTSSSEASTGQADLIRRPASTLEFLLACSRMLTLHDVQEEWRTHAWLALHEEDRWPAVVHQEQCFCRPLPGLWRSKHLSAAL